MIILKFGGTSVVAALLLEFFLKAVPAAPVGRSQCGGEPAWYAEGPGPCSGHLQIKKSL